MRQKMKKFKEIEKESEKSFKRMTGISKKNYQELCNKVKYYLNEV